MIFIYIKDPQILLFGKSMHCQTNNLTSLIIRPAGFQTAYLAMISNANINIVLNDAGVLNLGQMENILITLSGIYHYNQNKKILNSD